MHQPESIRAEHAQVSRLTAFSRTITLHRQGPKMIAVRCEDLDGQQPAIQHIDSARIIGGGAALTLDVQYVKHPAATEKSSVVPGIRFQLDF